MGYSLDCVGFSQRMSLLLFITYWWRKCNSNVFWNHMWYCSMDFINIFNYLTSEIFEHSEGNNNVNHSVSLVCDSWHTCQSPLQTKWRCWATEVTNVVQLNLWMFVTIWLGECCLLLFTAYYSWRYKTNSQHWCVQDTHHKPIWWTVLKYECICFVKHRVIACSV